MLNWFSLTSSSAACSPVQDKPNAESFNEEVLIATLHPLLDVRAASAGSLQQHFPTFAPTASLDS